MNASTADTLLRKALRAFKWNVAGIVARVVMQFSVMIVLARLVGPKDFGFFGASLLVYGLAVLVADLGLGMSLVQRKSLPEGIQRIAWAWLLISHVAVAAVIVTSAPVLADLLGDSKLKEGIPWMALALALTAFLVLPMVELRRRMDFRTLQTAQVSGYFSGYVVVGIPLAAYGFGWWSLITALIVQQAVMVLVCWRAAPQPLLPAFGRIPKEVSAFGTRVVASNLANWMTENLDNLLVSRFRGLADLGSYSVSYNLARTPTNHVVNMVQQVVFATSSRAQDDVVSLRRGYMALVKAIGLATFPVFFGAAVVADSVITGLYGTGWAHAGPVFAALCVAMPFHALMAVAGPILWGRGRTNVELRVQTGVALALVVVLFVLRNQSLAIIAWGVCAVYIGRAGAMSYALARDLGIRWRQIFNALISPILLATASVGTLWQIEIYLAPLDLNPPLQLTCLICAAGIMLCILVFSFLPRVLGSELEFLSTRISILGRWL